jgi:hypothetical protein
MKSINGLLWWTMVIALLTAIFRIGLWGASEWAASTVIKGPAATAPRPVGPGPARGLEL